MEEEGLDSFFKPSDSFNQVLLTFTFLTNISVQISLQLGFSVQQSVSYAPGVAPVRQIHVSPGVGAVAVGGQRVGCYLPPLPASYDFPCVVLSLLVAPSHSTVFVGGADMNLRVRLCAATRRV